MRQSIVRDHFDALESCRGLACMLVVVHHCGLSINLSPLHLFGFTGVHFFFVLSGFLLYRPFAAALNGQRDWPTTGNYLARRIIRIFPPYWVSLLIFTLLRAAAHAKLPSTWDLIAHALLIFNFDSRLNFFGINAVFWSLAVEAHFYLLLPLVARVGTMMRGAAARVLTPAAILLVVGLASRFVEFTYLEAWNQNSIDTVRIRTTFSYLDLFSFGMAAAGLQVLISANSSWKARLQRSRGLLLAAGATVFLAGNWWSARTTNGDWQGNAPPAYMMAISPVLCGGLALILLAVIHWPDGGPRVLKWRAIAWIGCISYSLYLYHTGIQFFVFKLKIGLNWPWTLMALTNSAISLPLAIGAASVMYYLVEAPCLAIVSRIRSKQAGSPKEPLVAPLIGP